MITNATAKIVWEKNKAVRRFLIGRKGSVTGNIDKRSMEKTAKATYISSQVSLPNRVS